MAQDVVAIEHQVRHGVMNERMVMYMQ